MKTMIELIQKRETKTKKKKTGIKEEKNKTDK